MSGKITVKDVLDFLDNGDESDVDMLSESYDDDSDLTLPGGNAPRDGELDIDDELSNSSDSDSDSSDDLPLATFQRKSLTPPTSYSWQSVPFIAPDDGNMATLMFIRIFIIAKWSYIVYMYTCTCTSNRITWITCICKQPHQTWVFPQVMVWEPFQDLILDSKKRLPRPPNVSWYSA